jgi:predicted transcriptional regulator
MILEAVRNARPHALPARLAADLGIQGGVVQHTLDALIRKNLVTPVGYHGREVYVATQRGREYA